MGFFGKIFGERKGREHISLELKDVDEFFSKQVSEQKEQLLKEAASKIAEVKHLLRELQNGLEQLQKASVESENRKLEKIVSTSKSNAVRQLRYVVEKMQPPNESDLENVREYCNSSIVFLQREVRSFGKNIAYTSISLKQHVKQLGITVKQLNDTLFSLQKSMNASSAVFLEAKVKETATALREKIASVEAIKKSIDELEKGIASLQAELEKNKNALALLCRSQEYRGISALNEEKGSLLRQKQQAKTEVIDLIAKVEKVLRRLQKAVNARKVFIDRELVDFLEELLSKPFFALKADPKGVKLRKLLQETKSAINSGLIDLKEREREKRLAALDEMMVFNFFEKIFWHFNKLDAELAAVEKRLSKHPALEKEKAIEGAARGADEKLREAKGALEEKSSRLSKAGQGIVSLKQALQSMLSEASGNQIELKIGQ